MPRRGQPAHRVMAPDARYGSQNVQRLINKVMLDGKKSLAEHIIYRSFELVEQQTGRQPVEVFEQALRGVTPAVRVRPRRVGGATYQVPVEVPSGRGRSLGLQWLVRAARARKGRPMWERLGHEIVDAARGQGGAAKRKEDMHRMADANRAFAHYRW